MYFRWNNAWQAILPIDEKRQIAFHQRCHVVMASAPIAVKNQANEEISAFTQGYPCPEPLLEEYCVLTFSVIDSKR